MYMFLHIHIQGSVSNIVIPQILPVSKGGYIHFYIRMIIYMYVRIYIRVRVQTYMCTLIHIHIRGSVAVCYSVLHIHIRGSVSNRVIQQIFSVSTGGYIHIYTCV